MPPVYLQLHAEHIHTVGVEQAVQDVEAMLVADLFPRRMKHWLLRHYDRDHPNLRKYG